MNYLIILIPILLFGLSGLINLKKLKKDDDFFFTSNGLNSKISGISSWTTNNSAFMLTALAAYTYIKGLEVLTFLGFWLLGEFFAWTYLIKKIKQNIIHSHHHSLIDLIFKDLATPQAQIIKRLFITIIVLLLGIYASAQLLAIGKVFQSVMGLKLEFGILFATILLSLYTLTGGLKAISTASLIQGACMLLAILILAISGISKIGGPLEFYQQFTQLPNHYHRIFPQSSILGILGYLIGLFTGGLGIIGQPHIMASILNIDKLNNLNKSKRLYFTMYSLMSLLIVCSSLCCRILYPPEMINDPESILIFFTKKDHSEVVQFIFLMGFLGAALSTVDSQILSSSQMIGQDWWKKHSHSISRARYHTLFMTLVVCAIALYAPLNIFHLVMFSWSLAASLLLPLLLLYLVKGSIPLNNVVMVIIISSTVCIFWRISSLSSQIYEVLPSLLANALYIIPQLILNRK